MKEDPTDTAIELVCIGVALEEFYFFQSFIFSCSLFAMLHTFLPFVAFRPEHPQDVQGFFIGGILTNIHETDQNYMRRALELAERGLGWTSPNPMVGAVIVKDGRILSEGWHVRCGELHAERHALSRCTEDPSGATI